MTTKTKLILLGTILTVGAAHIVTHTDTFVASLYEKRMAKECGIDIMCRLGAGLIEAPVVACMEDKVISFSDTTLIGCLNEVTQKVKGE